VLDATRAEFRKVERPYNDADFVWDEPEEAEEPKTPVPHEHEPEAVA
jgi:hypothetical protein